VTQRRIYQTEYPYFVTFVTVERVWVFDDTGLAERMARTIVTSCELKGWLPMAFSILPDHVHLVAARVQSTSRTLEKVRSEDYLFQSTLSRVRRSKQHRQEVSVSQLVQSIKGTFSRDIHEGRFWQPRFHARIIISERQRLATFTYVTHNYARHDLPERYATWPYVYRCTDH